MLYRIAWAHVCFYNGFYQNLCSKQHGFHAFIINKQRYGKSTDYYARHIGRIPSGQKWRTNELAQDKSEWFPLLGRAGDIQYVPHYGMLDLMDAKERHEKDCTFFMKVTDQKSAEYAGGVFLFKLADELVIYLLPITYKSGKNITGRIQLGQWTLRETKVFRNNVCRLIYRLKE